MLGHEIAYPSDILITRETARPVAPQTSARAVWVLVQRGTRVGRPFSTYREAALHANALAREMECSIWYHESGHPLLLLNPAQMPGLEHIATA